MKELDKMKSFFSPDSVALIGVPRKSGPGSFNNLEIMLRYGFKGLIYVVHPEASEICGLKTYPSVELLPEVPELAVISVGRERVLSVFQECAGKGFKNVIVISQGFADADDRGRKLQEQLAEEARQKGVRVLGPNTLGILDAFSGFSTAFLDIKREQSPPPLALVAQSGLFQVGFESFTGSLGKGIDLGNSCDVDFVDALEYLETDPQTEVIAIHMEGLKRGRSFLEAASRVSRRKPVVVFKTGRSSEGARAAVSHTGSMVGEDSAFEKAFEKAGIIKVNSMVEFLAASRALLKFKEMKGPRVGVVTATGAGGIITLDAFEDFGLKPAPLREEVSAELESPRVSWHKLRNPLDIWPMGMVSGSFSGVFKKSAGLLLQEKDVDAVLGIAPVLSSHLHPDLDMASCIEEILRCNAAEKPLAVFGYGDGRDKFRQALEEMDNVCFFSSVDEAVMGLSAALRCRRGKNREIKDKALGSPEISGKRARPSEPPGGGVLLGEWSFELLKHYGIPAVPGKTAGDPASAVSLAESMGYPVALKIVSSQWVHKSELGGVRPGISSAGELEAAFGELKDLFYRQTPEGSLEGMLVQKHISGTELLFGLKRDPQVGHIVLAGFGGIYTEIFRDISRELVPVSGPEAQDMLESLYCFPLLKGYRGSPKTDISALKGIILSLSMLAEDYPEVEELDLNPVIVNEEGAWCVDSRIVFSSIYPRS